MPRPKRYENFYQYPRIFDISKYLNYYFHLRPIIRTVTNPEMPVYKFDLASALRTFKDMKKDFVDTFKPYKGRHQRFHDLLQPIYGIGNFLRGIALFLYATLVFVFTLFDLKSTKEDFSKVFIVCAESIANIIRGITQVIFTPFTYLIKMPLREVISLFQDVPLVEKNSSLSEYIEELTACFAERHKEKNYSYIYFLLQSINEKFQISVCRSQKTMLDSNKEFQLAKPFAKSINKAVFYQNRLSSYPEEMAKQDKKCEDHFRNYIQFFRPAKANLPAQDTSKEMVANEAYRI